MPSRLPGSELSLKSLVRFIHYNNCCFIAHPLRLPGLFFAGEVPGGSAGDPLLWVCACFGTLWDQHAQPPSKGFGGTGFPLRLQSRH